MSLTRLAIHNFRNILTADIELLPTGLNLFYGNNGSGKTSLLESIYYLALGRSFRSTSSRRIVNHAASKFSLYADFLTENNQKIPLGLEREHDGGLKARINGKDVRSIAEIANLLPIQYIHSNCHTLLDSGPAIRRKFIDWGVFYHNNDFLTAWQQFSRALKQRNAALSNKVSKKELDIWTEEVIHSAISLHQMRQDYIDQLLPLLTNMVGELLTLTDLKITYYPGWNIHDEQRLPLKLKMEIDSERLEAGCRRNARDGVFGASSQSPFSALQQESLRQDYRDILRNTLDKDLYSGFTESGPHRANLNITINKLPAKDILSRGQQKLFVCAMILAQGAFLFSTKNRRPIYLIDDLSSELDIASRTKLMTLLSKQQAQILVTAVEDNVFDQCSIAIPGKLFHVEHGVLEEESMVATE